MHLTLTQGLLSFMRYSYHLIDLIDKASKLKLTHAAYATANASCLES